jgi:hypothetical protein
LIVQAGGKKGQTRWGVIRIEGKMLHPCSTGANGGDGIEGAEDREVFHVDATRKIRGLADIPTLNGFGCGKSEKKTCANPDNVSEDRRAARSQLSRSNTYTHE